MYLPPAASKKYRVPSARRKAASTWLQVVGSRSVLPGNCWSVAGWDGAAMGRQRKLPPLWSTLYHGPSWLSAGRLNRTISAGGNGVVGGALKKRGRAGGLRGA